MKPPVAEADHAQLGAALTLMLADWFAESRNTAEGITVGGQVTVLKDHIGEVAEPKLFVATISQK